MRDASRFRAVNLPFCDRVAPDDAGYFNIWFASFSRLAADALTGRGFRADAPMCKFYRATAVETKPVALVSSVVPLLRWS